METKWQSFLPSAEGSRTGLTATPLSLEHVIQLVADSKSGAIVTFAGTVRGTENRAAIGAIRYEAYAEMAEKELAKVIEQAEKRWGVSVALRHRIGKVSVGEASLIVACTGVHRREAFEACQFVVDEIKTKVPIWKAGFDRL